MLEKYKDIYIATSCLHIYIVIRLLFIFLPSAHRAVVNLFISDVIQLQIDLCISCGKVFDSRRIDGYLHITFL